MVMLNLPVSVLIWLTNCNNIMLWPPSSLIEVLSAVMPYWPIKTGQPGVLEIMSIHRSCLLTYAALASYQ